MPALGFELTTLSNHPYFDVRNPLCPDSDSNSLPIEINATFYKRNLFNFLYRKCPYI